MKILSIRERMVNIGSPASNAAISFNSMTASAVVVEIETCKGRFKGLGFSSIGRYGHGGLLRERFIPRLLNANCSLGDLRDCDAGTMAHIWQLLMANEKEGGHGERSGAVGVLETALWDAFAKSEDLPLWALLHREFGQSTDHGCTNDRVTAGRTRIYASGGHYNQSDTDADALQEELKSAMGKGYGWFKLKVGGASAQVDALRIEQAIKYAGNAGKIAVDANGAYDGTVANEELLNLDHYDLRWIEEPVKPLNYHGLNKAVASLQTPIATGENCFSAADTGNLLRYGGLRSGKDILQIDFILSYGITEYVRMIHRAETAGWCRRDFIPHAGHQAALHVCAGLGLGAHETASLPGPFGGVCDGTRIDDGIAILGDRPGTGIENKPALFRYFEGLMD
jgi:D(-)-tartrate dehydratase